MEHQTQSSSGSERLMCVDALRGFDMLWITGGAEVVISLCKASGIGFRGQILSKLQQHWLWYGSSFTICTEIKHLSRCNKFDDWI